MVKQVSKIIINLLLGIIILTFLISMFLFVQGKLNPNNIPSLMGYKPLNVLSGSMEPVFSAGDMIVVKQQETLNKNNIITFRESNEKIVTHRVVDILQDNGKAIYITKGDNNRVIDEGFVTEGQVIGTYLFRIPNFGLLGSIVKSPLGYLLLIVIPGILLLINEIQESRHKRKISRDKKIYE